jgi:serine/threonine protein kinase/tetratricopeptide (TPR) repeat protein
LRPDDGDRTQIGDPIPGASPPAPDPNVTIPDYKILRQLGEGGMGEVYEAEQERPVQRRVAIKLIKLGMDTRRVITRFASERQALALMDHPHIAQVFDAGATAAGRPYFVMEYVDGIPIDDFCAQNGLETQARLQLFLQVCEGIQHAHQKGVIHRDIKPSNILVRWESGSPLPKIIDFGVAKATTRSLTEMTQFTETGQFIGTPEYMSPEQLEMSTTDIDTRSDVYALGVLLYKLLVGRTPFEVGTLGLDEVRRTMRDRDPTRPSTRLASMHGDAGPLPSLQPADRSRIARHLRGDLDWITMKALEKERARRYASVSEMAEDIRRHLRHQPVSAGPPGAAYRLGKFVRRHRVGTAAGALVVLALVGGTVAASIGMARALRAERAARSEAARANAEAEGARSISDFLESLFEINDPSQARGSRVTAREILDRGAAEIRQQFADRPIVRARLMDAIGRVYENLGLYAPAEPLLREALEIRESRLGPDHAEVAASLRGLGGLYDARGDLESCRRVTERALRIDMQNLGPDHPVVATDLHNLGKVLGLMGQLPAAREHFERAAQMREAALGAVHPELALTLHGLADVLKKSGELAAARPLYERALAIQQQVLAGNHPELAATLVSLAGLLRRTGEPERARALYERALSIQEQAYGPEHLTVAATLNQLADLLAVEQQRPAAARPLLQRSLAIRESVLGADHASLAPVIWEAAGLSRVLGESAAADALYRRSLAITEAALGPDHPRLAYNRACYAALHGDRDGAILWLRRAVERGYADASNLAADSDLRAVREDPAFQELLAGLQRGS